MRWEWWGTQFGPSSLHLVVCGVHRSYNRACNLNVTGTRYVTGRKQADSKNNLNGDLRINRLLKVFKIRKNSTGVRINGN